MRVMVTKIHGVLCPLDKVLAGRCEAVKGPGTLHTYLPGRQVEL